MENQRVIDAHVHFWDAQVLRYPWLDHVPALRRAFLPADMASLESARIDGVVFVEANCRPDENLAELDFAESLAVDQPRIQGYVAFVDMLDAESRRRSFGELERRTRVTGVRHNIQGQASGFCVQREFVCGVQESGARGLVFDLCATADQLGDVLALVRQCPETQFILDHCGKPSIRTDAFEPWAGDIARLAEVPNVACKLSGLLSEARPDQRTPEAIHRYARHVMSCFGESRLIYGSDWPVVMTAGGERFWRSFAQAITSDWTPAARQAFFFDNAVRLYRLRVNGNH